MGVMLHAVRALLASLAFCWHRVPRYSFHERAAWFLSLDRHAGKILWGLRWLKTTWLSRGTGGEASSGMLHRYLTGDADQPLVAGYLR